MAIILRSMSNPNWKIPVSDKPVRIGRGADNHFVLQDKAISRQHAMVQLEGGVPVIMDMKSTRGTFVNGNRVQRASIKPGDIVSFGPLQFQVVMEDAPRPVVQKPAVVSPPASAVKADPPSSPPKRPVPVKKKAGFPAWAWALVVVGVLALAYGVADISGIIDPKPTPTSVAALPTTVAQEISVPQKTAIPEDVLERAKSATIRIEAKGSWVSLSDTLELETDNEWVGTGFVIQPEGIAVTNSHIVAGAGSILVYFPGESKPRNAKVLGVSECSDLAIIDIDGEGYPYLEFDISPVSVGQDIFVAGYPLGDPEFTLTKGVISKESADGETYWASIDGVIEHDARFINGNSGGPLIDADTGKVLGINYARDGFEQYYSISSADAKTKYLDELAKGIDVESLGIDGVAVSTSRGNGIWVHSVKSGSMADRAGIKAGMLITRIENISAVGEDLTMQDYCEVLRSRNLSDTLNIEAYYYAPGVSGGWQCGQINGRAMAPGKCTQ